MAGKAKGTAAPSADEVIDAAVAIADRDGLEALTVRGLARSLGVQPMSLYRFFSSRDALLDAMADALLGRLVTPEVRDGVSADRYLVELAHAIRRLMDRHPSVVNLFATRTTFSQRSLGAAMEAPLRGLVQVGFGPEEAVRAYGVLLTFALGFQTYVNPRPWGDEPELRRQQVALYQTLPLPDFEMVVANAEHVASLPGDEQFTFGAEVLGRALAQLVRAG